MPLVSLVTGSCKHFCYEISVEFSDVHIKCSHGASIHVIVESHAATRSASEYLTDQRSRLTFTRKM
jgi:hypothetical protein